MEVLIMEDIIKQLGLINIEKAEYKSIDSISEIKEVAAELKNSKLLYMEPIIDGEKVAGLNMYFQLTNGTQKALEIYSSDTEPDVFCVNIYS